MLKWNLEELFKNSEECYQKMEEIKSIIEKLDINVELDEHTLFSLLDKRSILKEQINNCLIYGSLRYYKNIHDEECVKLKEVVEKFENECNTFFKKLDLAILKLGKEKVWAFLNQNKKLEIYRLYLDNLFRLQEHIKDTDTLNRVKENNNAINEQLNEYNKSIHDLDYGSILVDGKEEHVTTANFAKFLSSRDRKVRKQTYLNVNESYKKESSKFASILNAIYKLRSDNFKLEGYYSVLEKSLFEENINPIIIDRLIESVHKNLSLMQKYLQLKASYLRIDAPHLYDFGVPLDNNEKKTYTLEEAIEIIKNALKPLGEEYLKVVELLLDGHIDASLDENKHQSITFSWHTYSFLNFRGSYNDLKNLIHEIGHIVNYYLSKENVPFIYEDSTVFVGETASTVNEILLNRYLYETSLTEEEKIFYLSKQVENYFVLVFKQTMYTEFEKDLYENILTSEMTDELLNEKFGLLQKKYYGQEILYDDVSKFEWARLGHLYRWSYYPYKYATGLLIANAVVYSLLEDKSLSQQEYLDFLASGSSRYSLDLLKMLHIDLTDSKIIDNGFHVLKKSIEELEQVLILKQK